MIHGPDVVDHFVQVPGAGFRAKQIGLGGQKILQRALRTFDLAGEHGLLADIHEDEQVGIREGLHGAVETAQGPVGLGEQGLQPALQAQGGSGGSGAGMNAR